MEYEELRDLQELIRICPVDRMQYYWGHPVLFRCFTGDCTGNHHLIKFLRDHSHDIAYSSVQRTVDFCLDRIAAVERHDGTFTAEEGLRMAMTLSHMARGAENPFRLTEEESAMLACAGTDSLSQEGRVEVYRRAITPSNLDKLRKIQENNSVREKLFELLDRISKEETI